MRTRADVGGVDIGFRCVTRLASHFSVRAADLRANGDIQSGVLVSANRANVTYDCNVSRAGSNKPGRTSRRVAPRRDGNGKVQQKLNDKKRRANCFETVLLLIGMPPPCRAEIEPCKKMEYSILRGSLRVYVAAVFSIYMAHRSIGPDKSIELDPT